MTFYRKEKEPNMANKFGGLQYVDGYNLEDVAKEVAQTYGGEVTNWETKTENSLLSMKNMVKKVLPNYH